MRKWRAYHNHISLQRKKHFVLLKGSQVSHVLRQEQRLFKHIGHVARFAFLESKGKGAPSSSSGGFQILTLGQRLGTLCRIVPSPEDFFYTPLAIFSHFWGSSSLEGITSPSLATSLTFLSRILFLSTDSDWEVWMERGVWGGSRWTPRGQTLLRVI